MIKTENKNRSFKFTLEELYQITDGLIAEIKTEEVMEFEKGFLISELIETTEQLVKNNCKRFIRKNNADELTITGLYETATSFSLWKAIQDFDIEKGVHFLTYWNMIQQSHFMNDFKKATSQTMKFHQHNICSSDVEIDGDGNTILAYKEDDSDLAEEVSMKLTLDELIDTFEKTDKYGKLIRCELIGTQAIKTQAMLKVLDADVYGNTQRKQVQRTKERFAKLLIENGFEM